MKYTAQDFKKAMNNYKELVKAADAAMELYEANPYDAAIEHAFDEAYNQEHVVFQQIVVMVMNMTGLSESLAATLVRSKEDELVALAARIA